MTLEEMHETLTWRPVQHVHAMRGDWLHGINKWCLKHYDSTCLKTKQFNICANCQMEKDLQEEGIGVV